MTHYRATIGDGSITDWPGPEDLLIQHGHEHDGFTLHRYGENVLLSFVNNAKIRVALTPAAAQLLGESLVKSVGIVLNTPTQENIPHE